MLAERGVLDVTVFYTWGSNVMEKKFDPGFGKNIEWDIPLLEGYSYCFVENIAKNKGSHHFKGIDNPSLIRQIIDWRPDAVMIYGWNFKSHLAAMRFFKNRIPVLFRGDSVSIHHKGIKKIIRNWWLSRIYRNIDKALYTGKYNRQYFTEAGIKEDQLVYVPHAIDNKRFSTAVKENANEIAAKRKTLGINENDIVFLYAGKLDTNKNVQLLASVFHRLKLPASHLLIAGNGSDETVLKKTYAGNATIHFLPFQNQSHMPILYGVCDVFVLPSLTETWGLALNEAMACSKAIVASSGCGAAIDLIENGKNGYIFKSNDEASLENVLHKISGEQNRLQEMGRYSLQQIAGWSFEKDCEAIEACLF